MYYNVPSADSGPNQIIKLGNIRRNETFYLPNTTWAPGEKYVFAFDPARTNDNSILSIMRIYEDKDYGWCGDIINCINFIDEATKKKLKLDSNRQLEMIRNTILKYNGTAPDYENIDTVLIDTGAGGGGLSTYSDALLNNWFDFYGKEHRGLIDACSSVYAEIAHRYPDAIDKLRGIDPKRERTKMVQEFIELMELGVLRFPHDYNGSDFINILRSSKDDDHFEVHELTDDEKRALTQIDLMKNEIISIHKYTNAEKTSITYALSPEKRNKMHDDRFYTAILLAHRLYELRRGQVLNRPQSSAGLETFIQFKRPVIRTRR